MKNKVQNNTYAIGSKKSFAARFANDVKVNRAAYMMILPVLLFYIVFAYLPMYGIIIAFKDYDISTGILGSPWVGFANFKSFFSSMYFGRVLKNTLVISLCSIIFGFPAPIILALLLNEVKRKWFLRTVQTITYLPHFISLVVICGMIKSFTAQDGIINYIIEFFGGTRSTLLMNANAFVPIYIVSDIWQGVGWGSIVYFAALTNVDSELYEACTLDGGGRIRQVFTVTLPGIMPTIMIMLILRLGSILGVGYEKIILLYNPTIYKTADVISTFVYRKGLVESDFGYATAVGLFNSVVNVIFLVGANLVSRKVTETSLW